MRPELAMAASSDNNIALYIVGYLQEKISVANV
jgi:hypothetical protein